MIKQSASNHGAVQNERREEKKNKREICRRNALRLQKHFSPFLFYHTYIRLWVFGFYAIFFPTSLDAFSVVSHMWSLSEVNVFISHSVKRNAISQRFLNHLTRYSCIFCKNKYYNSACCFHVLLERNPKHDLFMIHSQRENVRIKKIIQRWKYL